MIMGARYGLPLPRLKSRSMYMQTTKANETRDDFSYKLHEHLLRANRWAANQLHPWGLKRSEISQDCRLIVLLTPIANTSSMFPPCVKHRVDNHETSCHGSLTHTKDEPNNEETCEVLASGVTAQGNSPDKNVQTWAHFLRRLQPDIEWCETHLIHLLTGNLCRAKFCGTSKAR